MWLLHLDFPQFHVSEAVKIIDKYSFSKHFLWLPILKCILRLQKFIDFIVSSFVSPPKKIGNGIAVSGRFPQLPSIGTVS